eukprot:360723-Chlamydomonas_euryale.AAC.8
MLRGQLRCGTRQCGRPGSWGCIRCGIASGGRIGYAWNDGRPRCRVPTTDDAPPELQNLHPGLLYKDFYEELLGQDLADALLHMHEKGRYNELLLCVESCEAGTMIEKISAPGVVATGSSVRGVGVWTERGVRAYAAAGRVWTCTTW